MQGNAQRQYLAAKVLTATPQKLHLMLIDGAIRSAQQTKETWQDDLLPDECRQALMRCMNIAGEMLASVRGCKLDFSSQLTRVYAFIFRRVTEAYVHRNLEKLDEAIHLLQIERETWQQVCQKFGSEVAPPSAGNTSVRRADTAASIAVPIERPSIPPLPHVGPGSSVSFQV